MQVPRCDILVAGYSCKDLSGLNNKPAAIDDTSRGSGQTLQAALSYVSRYEPTIVVLENVKTMYSVRSMDQGQKPMVYLTTQMKSRGYVGPAPQMQAEARVIAVQGFARAQIRSVCLWNLGTANVAQQLRLWASSIAATCLDGFFPHWEAEKGGDTSATSS